MFIRASEFAIHSYLGNSSLTREFTDMRLVVRIERNVQQYSGGGDNMVTPTFVTIFLTLERRIRVAIEPSFSQLEDFS